MSISAQARLALMLEVKPFWPTSGGSCVCDRNPDGATPGSAVGETVWPFVDVAGGVLKP